MSLPDSEVPSTPAGHRRTQPRAHPVPAGRLPGPTPRLRGGRHAASAPLGPCGCGLSLTKLFPSPSPAQRHLPAHDPPVLTGISPSRRVTARTGPAARARAARLTRLESGDSHWRQPSTSQVVRTQASSSACPPSSLWSRAGRPSPHLPQPCRCFLHTAGAWGRAGESQGVASSSPHPRGRGSKGRPPRLPGPGLGVSPRAHQGPSAWVGAGLQSDQGPRETLRAEHPGPSVVPPPGAPPPRLSSELRGRGPDRVEPLRP